MSQQRNPGRPAIAKGVRTLIRDMWRTNPTWGSPRIVGELRKLGIEVAKSTVEKYRIAPPKPPSPTWKTFLKNHIQDLVALDCFTVPTATLRVLCVLVILAHKRRRVVHVNVTEHPTAAWTAQQVVEAFPWDEVPRSLLRDRDRIYQRFHGLTRVTPTAKELTQGTALLTTHGLEKAQYLLTFSHQAAQVTRYHPQVFGGILLYTNRALAAYDAPAAPAAQVATRHAAADERTRREQYQAWEHRPLAQLRATLPPEELAAREAEAHARLMAADTPAVALPLAARIQGGATPRARPLVDALSWPKPLTTALRQTWQRHYDRATGEEAAPGHPPMASVRFKLNHELPPAAEGIASPYDPEARYRQKCDT